MNIIHQLAEAIQEVAMEAKVSTVDIDVYASQPVKALLAREASATVTVIKDLHTIAGVQIKDYPFNEIVICHNQFPFTLDMKTIKRFVVKDQKLPNGEIQISLPDNDDEKGT